MRRSNSLLALLLIVVVAGCASDTDRLYDGMAMPSATLPKAALQVAGDSTTLQVDLPTVLALTNSGDLVIASAAEQVALLEAERDLAAYRFFPSIRVGVGSGRLVGQYMSTTGIFVDTTRQETVAALRTRLEVPLGDAVFGMKSADAQLRAGRFEHESTRRRRFLEASTAYFDLLASSQSMAIARDALAFAVEQRRYHESRLENGLGLAVDVERARAREEAERIAVESARGVWRRHGIDLARMIRVDPRHPLMPAVESALPVELVEQSRSLDDLIAAALKTNPVLAAADAHVDAEDHLLEAARWGWLIPSLVADGAVETRGQNPGRLGGTEHWNVGLEWQISLGQGARIRAARARRNQVAMALTGIREKLLGAVVASHQAAIETRGRIAASRRRIKAAEAALQLAESRMRAGAGLMLEVLDARVEVTQAQLSLLDAITEFNTNEVRLSVLTGESPLKSGESSR